MSDAPEHIWTHEDENRRRWFFKAQCMPQASLTTTKYVRADIAAARIAALEAEVADLRLELDVTQSALRTSVSNVMERRLPEAAYARGVQVKRASLMKALEGVHIEDGTIAAFNRIVDKVMAYLEPADTSEYARGLAYTKS
jgi:hypothetical protein